MPLHLLSATARHALLRRAFNSYRAATRAYKNVLEALNLPFVISNADNGNMGGEASQVRGNCLLRGRVSLVIFWFGSGDVGGAALGFVLDIALFLLVFFSCSALCCCCCRIYF